MSENQKKVWVTGASSGIGKAVAEKFAKENWKVAISARRENLLNEMAKNENIFAYPMDVTDSNKTQETFNKILKDFKEEIIKTNKLTYKEEDFAVIVSCLYGATEILQQAVAPIDKNEIINTIFKGFCVGK